ncbi:hypothetical protein FQN52_000823 [Onygenales sp. PD_12]|nr:hypothetical protein FQN53_002040 [Emmonsiellopsis sp. PD_33]KAK2782613.1 hypothetical protein FQN52_000823 [Onygenales sp. PD_12]
MKWDIDEFSDYEAGVTNLAEVETLRGNLKKCLKTSQFTDLVIKTREKEHKVHKIIICGQSTVFSRMLSGDWKEAKEGVVNLMDDHPTAVEAMINFMYTFKYHNKNEEEWESTLFHFRVYEVAEKYSVAPLEFLAKEKVEEILESGWDVEDFFQLIQQVYLSTSSGAGTLRKTIAEQAYLNMDVLLPSPEFLRLLKEIPKFSIDIGRRASEISIFTCSGCKEKSFCPLKAEAAYCVCCGRRCQFS